MTADRKKILAISGSTRKNSSNESILKFIIGNYSHLFDMEIFDGIDKLPHFNPDLDNENPPDLIKRFRSQIEQADGILICTPEYVFSIPGSLKNAIEWNVSTTLFSNKPIAFIVASASGEKAFESLDRVMTTIESKMTKNSKLLIQGVKGKIRKDGKINDRKTIDGISLLLKSFVETIEESLA